MLWITIYGIIYKEVNTLGGDVMRIMYLLCEKYKIHPAEIFKLAFEYWEIPFNPDALHDYFLHCLKCVDKRGRIYVVEVEPEEVTDFCIFILAGRVKLPRYYHRGKIK